MHAPKMRPTMTRDLAVDAERGIAALVDAITREPGRYRCQRAGTHVNLWFDRQHRRLWSPWVSVEIAPAEGGSVLHARFAPSPGLWTCFMLTYLALGTTSFFAMMWGWSQHNLDHAPTALWIVPACALVGGVMFASSQIGQRLARDQMYEVRDLLDELARISPEP